MAAHAEIDELSDGESTRSSLPHHIMGKIIREVSFQDKVSLELVNKELNAILSNPSPTDGVWGTCDLMWDLLVDENLDSKEEILRWLTKRLPGFTNLICSAPSAYQLEFKKPDQSEMFEANMTKAASWLVEQLPQLSSAGTSTFQLHLAIESEVASKLLKVSAKHRSLQDEFWPALSGRLTELCVNLEAAQMRMEVLNQLTNLTGLRITLNTDASDDESEKPSPGSPKSYALSLPGLESLYLNGILAGDFTLHCPSLRSLYMEWCMIVGSFSLQASLEDFTIRGISGPRMKETFPVSSLLGLTSLHCQPPGTIEARLLFGALPSMSALRVLELVSYNGQLPPVLPASLQVIIVITSSLWTPAELQHVAAACQLPGLQSLELYNCEAWQPSELSTIQKLAEESKASVTVKENWADEDNIIMGEDF